MEFKTQPDGYIEIHFTKESERQRRQVMNGLSLVLSNDANLTVEYDGQVVRAFYPNATQNTFNYFVECAKAVPLTQQDEGLVDVDPKYL